MLRAHPRRRQRASSPAGSVRIRRGAFARQDLAEDLGHGDGMFHALVQHEREPRRVAEIDPVGDLGLQKSGCALQAAERQVLAGFVAHDRDHHLGVAQIAEFQ